jgi:hypothetical protein
MTTASARMASSARTTTAVSGALARAIALACDDRFQRFPSMRVGIPLALQRCRGLAAMGRSNRASEGQTQGGAGNISRGKGKTHDRSSSE